MISHTMRVSATTLDKFRLWLEPEQDWLTENELIQTIKGEPFTPTRDMQLGLAYGVILRYPDEHRMLWGGYSSHGFQFAETAVDPMLDEIDRKGVFETKGTLMLNGVTLVAKADHLYGAHLSEFKATLGSFDCEKYLASAQWKVMTLIFEPELITYRVACLSENKKEGGVIRLRSLECFNTYPYAALEQDVNDLVREFVHYCKVRKLDELLKEKQRHAEAKAMGV